MSGLLDSEDEMPGNYRSRSRSPSRPRSRSRSRSPHSDNDVDLDNLTPQSKKYKRILEAVVSAQLAPVKKNINKLLDTSSQLKGSTDQNKRSLLELKKSAASIEDRLIKSAKADPKSSLSSYVITKMNGMVFRNLKQGKKKADVLTDVAEELLSHGAISATEEDALKAVAGTEFVHLKAHLRNLISQDLTAGNDSELPKAEHYLKNHLKLNILDEESRQYLIIMAFGISKFENSKQVPLSDNDKENKKKMTQHIDYWWAWVHKKFTKFEEDGYKIDGKLKTLINAVGYQKKLSDGAVRRPR